MLGKDLLVIHTGNPPASSAHNHRRRAEPMSTKYRNSSDVPLDTIITRLRELADAVTGGSKSQEREFTMRIPAECDRDADLVIDEAAGRLSNMQAENEALRAQLKETEEKGRVLMDMCRDSKRRVRELEAENEALRNDAERYRWLRRGGNDDIGVVSGFDGIDCGSTSVAYTYEEGLCGQRLDDAIDEAEQAGGEK